MCPAPIRPPDVASSPTVPASIATRVRGWLERFVIAERLCPFAAQALAAGEVLIDSEPGEAEAVLKRLAVVAETLPGGASESTVLLALTHERFADFDAYLDLFAIAEDLLEALGLDARVQLASFHPDYRFEGASADDPANWTNRSPLPLIHLLQVDAVARAIDRHADPEGIPVRNVDRLRALGPEAVEARASAQRRLPATDSEP